MPSKYEPTGRPPGRPKTPEVVKQNIADVKSIFANTTLDPRSIPLNNICPDCFPGGWPTGLTATGCQHGIWVRR